LSARLTRIARTRGITTPGGITVSVGNGTAVLRGVVSTPDARVLLAKVARLEPRIGQIDNQLSVAPSQNNPADRP
jgi:osmotically-inducible protein OsmY